MDKFIDKLEKLFTNIVSVFLVICFAAMIILAFVQVVARYVFHASVPWTDEAVRAFMCYTVFIGTILVYEQNGHVCVDNLVNAAPQMIKRIMLLICYAVQFIFCGLLFFGAVKYMKVASTRTLTTLPISLSYLYISAIISAVCTFVFVVRNFIKEVIMGKEL